VLLRDGIEVKDASGRVVGKSRHAGLSAVSQVAFTRVLTCLPILTLPPLTMHALRKTRLLRRYPRLEMPFNLGNTVLFSAPLFCDISI
jgi:hypothetical protein